MKKIISIFLATLMIFALCSPAMAENTTPAKTTLNINDPQGGSYVGYKLLNVSTALKTGNHHTDHGTEPHTDDCYNYAYTVNEKYLEILQAETLANGRNDLWENSVKPTDAAKVTQTQITQYLSFQTSDNGNEYHTMRIVADNIYREILKKGLTPDAEDLSGTEEIEQGYWMFADASTLPAGQYDSNSLVIVDTAGKDALTIAPKTALPTVEKHVKDIEDSEDSNIADNAWAETADHDIGDTVPFKLTATLPNNVLQYQSYEITFHDTLSEGLTLKDGTVKVYMYDTKHKADVDTDVNDGVDVTDKFVTTTTGLTDDCTFEVSCENILNGLGVTKDTTFVVYYEATLNENAKIGSDGNPNEVYLEFSNNPYGEGTGETEVDTVKVYTYKLIINKTDSHGHELEGAGFTLYKKSLATGEYEAIGTEVKGDDLTTFSWEGLDDGDYKLEETTTPEGYNTMSDILFSISAEHSEIGGVLTLSSLDGGQMGLGDTVTGIIEKDIVNHTGTSLPETGAKGTFLLIGGGALLVALASVFMITRKKMSVFED